MVSGAGTVMAPVVEILKRNGKVVKPPTYSKANLAKILEESGYRYRKKILASF